MKSNLFAVIIMTGGLLLSPSYLFAQNSGHKTITQELITLLEERPEIEVIPKDSLEKAKSVNFDIVTNPAQDLKNYYTYIGSVWPVSLNAHGDGRGIFRQF